MPKILMPSYIDVHSHVHFSAFDVDREEVIKRSLLDNVWMINVGTNKFTSQKAVELAEKHDRGVYSIIGIHPIHSVPSFHDKAEMGESDEEDRGETFDHDFYRQLGSHHKVLGIGETGLDYFHQMRTGADTTQTDAEKTKKKQEEIFRQQIELANELKKPLMLHIRNGKENKNAYKDVLDILRSTVKVRGNAHFFVGTKEEAKSFLDLGFTVSFTGVITFAKEYEELVKYIPLDSMLIETDCPYVAPAPHRGKRNEPLFVKETAQKIAEIKNLPLEDVKIQLVKNTLNLFSGIKIS